MAKIHKIMNELNPPIINCKRPKEVKCPKCKSIHVYWDKVFKMWHCAGLSFSCGYFWRYENETN